MKRSLRVLLLGIAASTLASAATPTDALANAPEAEVERQTPAVAAGKQLIAVLNADSATRAAFAGTAFATGALARQPAAARAAALDRLAADAGGFKPLSVKPQGERMVEIVAASNRGGRFARFVLFTSRTEAGKVADLFVLPIRDPAKAAKDAWPTGMLASTRIAAEIGKRMAGLAADDSFSGSVLVASGDEIVFRQAYGAADKSLGIANEPDTAFNIALIGKMFTAVAVLKLAEAGRLTLDDKLAKWVPDYPDQVSAQKITLRHLLTHMAGLGEWDGRQLTVASARDAARTMTAPQAAEPRARFAYSNAGYVLLSAVIEAATGQSYEEALSALVFQPLALKRTGFWPVTAIVSNRATGYLRPEDDPLGFGPRYANDQFLGFKGDASGGAYSTVDDLFAFHRALIGNRLLSADRTADVLSSKTDFVGAPRPSRYGYGVRLTDCAGSPTFGHSGGGPNSGVSNATYATLDGCWTVIVLSNYDPPVGEDLALSICEFLAGQRP